jgi:hypothetical protein
MDPMEGKLGTDKRTGQRVVRQGGQWVPLNQGKPAVQEAGMRGRMDLGLGPMVQAQSDMAAVEQQGNPFSLSENPGNAAAKALSGVGLDIPSLGVNFHPFEGAAKSLGGDDYQKYQQAAAAFESQLMPIMSGAAVSPSEAQRQIKASLPELGDSPANLKQKARTRAMMLNGAAKARNAPLPYPGVPTWGVNTMQVPQGGQAAGAQNDPLGIRRR